MRLGGILQLVPGNALKILSLVKFQGVERELCHVLSHELFVYIHVPRGLQQQPKHYSLVPLQAANLTREGVPTAQPCFSRSQLVSARGQAGSFLIVTVTSTECK